MPLQLGDGTIVEVTTPGPPVLRAQTPPAAAEHVLVVSGPQGPPGPAGGATYVHTQSSPAATWTITHNLGRRPLPALFPADSAGAAVWTDLSYPDNNTLVVEWPAPTAGVAYL